MHQKRSFLARYRNLFWSIFVMVLLSASLILSQIHSTRVLTPKNESDLAPGSRQIARVICTQAETLDPSLSDERSRPTYTTLPCGTVDYCESSADGFYTLSSGLRVYATDVEIEQGTLPDQNKISLTQSEVVGNHLVLTMDQTYNAPFQISFGEQDYADPYPKDDSRPDYSVPDFTCDSVTVEFYHCAEFSGKLALCDNNLFSEITAKTKQNGNTVLELKLKTENQFCGVTAEYNKKGQLCFYFTHPTPIAADKNPYGYLLTGKTVMLDAGHGGSDCGAKGESDAYTEAALNLILCNAIRTQLESIGATVIMTRTDDTDLSLAARTEQIVKYKPDIFVSVHRNAAENTDATGYENYYYFPFSKSLADRVFASVSPAFERAISVKYYPFYVNRTTTCPSILTENGFVSNEAELDTLKQYEHNRTLAKQTVQGIVDYFASLSA